MIETAGAKRRQPKATMYRGSEEMAVSVNHCKSEYIRIWDAELAEDARVIASQP